MKLLKKKTLFWFVLPILIILISILVILWRKCIFRGAFSIPPRGGISMQSFHFSINPIYLQTDPRWMNDKIGGSQEKLGAVGCTVTCVSMALAHYKIDLPPGKLNELLKQNNGFTKKGWLIWNSISKITNNKIEIKVPCRPNYNLIDSALKRNQPVIAKIFINKRIPHWVLIIGKEEQEYLIKDPLGNGKTTDRLSKYSSNIYSIRSFKKK